MSLLSILSLPRPEPSAGVGPYSNELRTRLDVYPECARNYTRYLAARANKTSRLDYHPVKLDIENVSRCNFACTMCAVSTWPKGKRAEDMTLDHFKSIIDSNPGLVEIKLNGLGEALMQGDEYFDMIRYARSLNIWVRMTTNASLLHLKDNYKKLIASGVNEIDISIDGADTETFQKIRVQSDFGRVKENCRILNEHCDSLGIVRAKMWTLVQRGNYQKLTSHVKLAQKLGFKQVVFSLQLHSWASEALVQRNAEAEVQLTPEHIQMILDTGAELGVRVAFWDVSEKFDEEHLCPWPFERAVVTSDMRTVPCCMIGDPDKFELAKGVPFALAWHGEEYVAFRQAHLNGKVPEVCKSCYKGCTK